MMKIIVICVDERIESNILEVLVEGFVSPILQIGDIDKIMT